MGAISKQVARRLARHAVTPWEEVSHSHALKMLVFRRDRDSTVERVVVYYERQSGSVITRHGSRIVQVFRDSLDSDVLCMLFDTPELYLQLGFRRIEEAAPAPYFRPVCDSDATRDELGAIDAELADIQERRARVAARLHGGCASCGGSEMKWLIANVSICVKQEVKGISEALCIALSADADGVVHIEKSGKIGWGGVISAKARKAITRLRREDRHVITASLGTRGRFFIGMKDDACIWNGSELLDELIEGGEVAQVAFGSAFDSFVVLYKDGHCAWSCIPRDFRTVLSGGDVRAVGMGSNGQFFALFKHGNVTFGGLGEDEKMAVELCDGSIEQACFGYLNSVVLRYAC